LPPIPKSFIGFYLREMILLPLLKGELEGVMQKADNKKRNLFSIVCFPSRVKRE